jgi:hypothetical protein
VIVDLIIGFLFTLLNSVLSLIPEYTPWDVGSHDFANGSFFGWENDLAVWLKAWDLFLPVSTFFVCLVVVLGAKALVGIVQLLQWLWGMLPFKSS